MPGNQAIRVAIVEDLAEVAEILRESINDEPDMVCRQVYGNAEEAVKFLKINPPDIVIMDIGLPGVSGIDAIKELSANCPETDFCMFTVYEDDDKLFNSLVCGAKGYILKSAGTDKVVSAVRELSNGGSPMSPSIARRVIDVFQKSNIKPIQPELPLTAREKELLQLLADGLLYKEIASQLTITTGTVKQHIHKIYGKLQVSNRTEAVNRYYGKG